MAILKKNTENKEPLKTRDPYKYYRNWYWGLQSAEWACVLTPVLAVFIAKWNEYFDFVNEQEDSVKLTIGCVLALVCAVLFIYKKARHQEKTEKKTTMLTYLFWIATIWVFVFLFKAIINDLFLIMSCELGGAAAAYGVDFATQEMRRKEVLYRDAINKLEAEEAAKKTRADKMKKAEEEKKRRAVE